MCEVRVRAISGHLEFFEPKLELGPLDPKLPVRELDEPRASALHSPVIESRAAHADHFADFLDCHPHGGFSCRRVGGDSPAWSDSEHYGDARIHP